MQINICPVFIARYCSLPFAVLRPDPSQLNQIHDLQRLDALLATLCEDACHALEKRIATVDGKTKTTLIQLRRDIHNRRFSKLSKYLITSSDKASDIYAIVTSVVSTHSLYVASLNDTDSYYHTYIQSRLTLLRTLLLDSPASKAMVLSSVGFTHRILDESHCSNELSSLTQTAYTLLQYISRCAGKTSPFSYFAPAAFGQISETSNSSGIPPQITPLVSHARINIQFVLETHPIEPSQHAQARVKINTSLHRVGNTYYWMCHHRHVDSIRSAAVKPEDPFYEVLDLLVCSIQRDEPSDAAIPLNTAHQRALVDAGILLEDRPIAGHSRSSKELALNAVASAFRSATLEQRIQLLTEATTLTTSRDHHQPGPERPDIRLIREDVTTVERAALGVNDISACVQTLTKIQRVADSEFNLLLLYRRILGRFFRKHFSAGATVPLLQFVERLFAEASGAVHTDESERPSFWAGLTRLHQGTKDEAETLSRSQAINDWIRRSTTIEVDGSLNILSDTSFPETPRREDRPTELYSAYILPTQTLGYHWVADHMGAGSGRGIARWFNYDSTFYQSFKEWTHQATGDGSVDIMITDDLVFHIDIAPSSISRCFDLPGVYNAGMELVKLGSCYVRLAPDGDAYLSLDRDGPTIFTHYQSLLPPTNRPWITQFLAVFQRPGVAFGQHSFTQRVRDLHPLLTSPNGNSAVKARRRVVADGAIVLSRANWSMPDTVLPHLTSERPSEIILAYRKWQLSMQLPDQIYVRLHQQKKDRVRYSYKPQYLDWSDPTWIMFFHKYRQRNKGDLFFQEAIPNPATESNIRGAEYMIHWAV